MSPAVLEHMTLEAKIAFVHYIDLKCGDGKTGPAIWREAFMLGYEAGANQRTMDEVQMEARLMLVSEYGASYANK